MADETPERVPFEAEWPQDMRHRPDPNRITSVSPGRPLKAGASAPAQRRELRSAGRPPATGVQTDRPPVRFSQDPSKEPSYYDVPILKSPPWKWEIAWYFFLGGLSTGAYTVGRMAERFGGKEFREVSRASAYTALAAFVPCPPLLIHDLGDPKRFHHMLRVFKPTSPMSVGTWAIMGYSGALTAEVARQWVLAHVPPHKRGPLLRAGTATAESINDVPGVPFALTVAGYTGVLLSSTANPLWSKNKWLGPLFSASAIATGAAATSLALSAFGKRGGREESHAALEHIDTAAHIAEAVCMGGFLKEAGEKGAALTKGSMKGHMSVAAGGLLAGEVLKLIPFRGTLRRWATILSSLLSLASGFSLRWAMVHAGHEAANDPHTNRLASRPRKA